MRLLYITTGLPFRQGRESFFVPEIAALARAGIEMRIVPRSRGQGEVEEGLEVLLPLTESQPLFSFRVGLLALVEAARAPRDVLRILGDILTSGSPRMVAKNLAVLPKGLFAAGVTRKWRADHIHAQWASTTATMGYIAHLLTGIPWSFTAHRWDIVDRNMLEKKIACASFARLISRSGVALISNAAPRANSTKYRVIHMGVVVPPVRDKRPTKDSRPGGSVLLCPANLLPVKGHVHLIEAVALLRSWGVECRLLIAGEGPERERIERGAQRLGVADRVEMMGHLPHAELTALYEAHEVDVVVLPSVDLGNGLHEGIPVALMEAMAHEVPVVSTTTGGIGELVIPGTGILVPPADHRALAEAIAFLLRNEQSRRHMGEAARERVSREFDVAGTASQLATEFAAAGEER